MRPRKDGAHAAFRLNVKVSLRTHSQAFLKDPSHPSTHRLGLQVCLQDIRGGTGTPCPQGESENEIKLSFALSLRHKFEVAMAPPYDLHEHGRVALQEMTVPELKDLSKERDLPISRTKGQLIDSLLRWKAAAKRLAIRRQQDELEDFGWLDDIRHTEVIRQTDCQKAGRCTPKSNDDHIVELQIVKAWVNAHRRNRVSAKFIRSLNSDSNIQFITPEENQDKGTLVTARLSGLLEPSVGTQSWRRVRDLMLRTLESLEDVPDGFADFIWNL
eukprot:m.206855 g.206855  ORF g.206855 m.206855 type:complete len:272 (+) comp15438_c0_seq1:156-971(+)